MDAKAGRDIIDGREALERGLAWLVRRDKRLARIADELGEGWTAAGVTAGDSRPSRRNSGFPDLLRIIVEQQLSVASANAIWGRVRQTVRPLTPGRFLKAGEQALRAAGLSARKVEYGRGLAAEIVAGRLDLGALAALPDQAVLAELVRIKGIGRWTAEIYLMFVLGRPDVWPAGDLALANSAQAALGLKQRPGEKEMDALAEGWRPWRSVAARLFWHHAERPGNGGP